MAMMAMTTNNSMRVKPRRYLAPAVEVEEVLLEGESRLILTAVVFIDATTIIARD
jgi:hypothetical protein